MTTPRSDAEGEVVVNRRHKWFKNKPPSMVKYEYCLVCGELRRDENFPCEGPPTFKVYEDVR